MNALVASASASRSSPECESAVKKKSSMYCARSGPTCRALETISGVDRTCRKRPKENRLVSPPSSVGLDRDLPLACPD